MITTEQERLKYEKTWNHKGYRVCSPGEILLSDFLSRNPERGTLVDLGCGTGRATKRLQEEGFDVLGVDLVNALEVDIPFKEACLWEESFPAKWAYSCDVLEHIPPEHIDGVLKNVDCEYFYFHIHLKEDKFGAQVGEKLHLTIQPHEWWLDKLNEYFEVTDHTTTDRTSTFFGKR